MTSLKHSIVQSFERKGNDKLSCCDKIADILLEHGANLYLHRHTGFPTLYAVGIKRNEMYQGLLIRLVYFTYKFFCDFHDDSQRKRWLLQTDKLQIYCSINPVNIVKWLAPGTSDPTFQHVVSSCGLNVCAKLCVGAIVDYTNATLGHRHLMPSVNEPK